MNRLTVKQLRGNSGIDAIVNDRQLRTNVTITNLHDIERLIIEQFILPQLRSILSARYLFSETFKVVLYESLQDDWRKRCSNLSGQRVHHFSPRRRQTSAGITAGIRGDDRSLTNTGNNPRNRIAR